LPLLANEPGEGCVGRLAAFAERLLDLFPVGAFEHRAVGCGRPVPSAEISYKWNL
jgi:hypothetical protein